MIVDSSAIRVHCAARLIAYYCSKGKPSYFIKPLWDSPLFQCYWGICTEKDTAACYALAMAALNKWEGDSALYHPYPVVMLLRKHTPAEQLQILDLLERTYGFEF